MIDVQPTFSVSELNSYVNLLLGLDDNLKSITVRGEISGFKRHTSGHLYFTLKDEKASVRVVMFKYNASRLSFFPKDGLAVNITGHVGLFEKDGSFQLYADSMVSTGSGDLYRLFTELKEELDKKGWFAATEKKQIPYLPSCVGVVTSPSGAAIEDIRKVIGRRFPGMPIRLYPASVQGVGAAEEIANAVFLADKEKAVDVLIVGRGGGSLEDLWAFNEMAVATAVHDCSIPVISAVGHEIDFSICDFVADVRAATPSAAAELAVPEFSALSNSLSSVRKRLENSILRGVTEKRNVLKGLENNPYLKNPHMILDAPLQRLESCWGNISDISQRSFADFSLRLKVAQAALKPYAEDSLLAKGFIVATKENGIRVFSAKSLDPGDRLKIRFKDGTANVSVIDVDSENV